jgi:lysophospholipase L1-like esterase
VKGTSDKFDPKNENVLARNRIAAGVMAAQGIPINDLYSLGAEHPEYFADAAHYNAAGKAGQGALVAKAIATLLK